MDIKLPESFERDLWRNKLIELYQKYWTELQGFSTFKFTRLFYLAEQLDKIATKIHTNSEESYISSTPRAKMVKKFQKEVDLLEKEITEIDDKFDMMPDSERQGECSEFKSILQILETITRELENIKIKIIHNPNNTIDFLDVETKIILKNKP